MLSTSLKFAIKHGLKWHQTQGCGQLFHGRQGHVMNSLYRNTTMNGCEKILELVFRVKIHKIQKKKKKIFKLHHSLLLVSK